MRIGTIIKVYTEEKIINSPFAPTYEEWNKPIYCEYIGTNRDKILQVTKVEITEEQFKELQVKNKGYNYYTRTIEQVILKNKKHE